MKKQTNPSIKAYLIRGAFYLLLLIAVCAIPFALAQRGAINRVAAKPAAIPGEAPPSSGPATVCNNYTTSTSTDTIVPGDTDIGNHCDDCRTLITFPFPVSLYGTSFPGALVGANGNLQLTGDSGYFGSVCPLPYSGLDEAILPYQGDLVTDTNLSADCLSFPGVGCGVFTSVTGTAPNRAFHIEWRAAFFGVTGTANFEVRFSENNPQCFDVIYGSITDMGLFEVSGVQQSTAGPGATTFSCLAGALTNGLKVTYCCTQPSPTPTPSPSPTPTPTPLSQITLTANGYKLRGTDTVDLLWRGAISANIDIKRDGVRIATVPRTPSSYTDNTGQRGPATFIYQVCEAGGVNCSNQVTVRFGGG